MSCNKCGKGKCGCEKKVVSVKGPKGDKGVGVPGPAGVTTAADITNIFTTNSDLFGDLEVSSVDNACLDEFSDKSLRTILQGMIAKICELNSTISPSMNPDDFKAQAPTDFTIADISSEIAYIANYGTGTFAADNPMCSKVMFGDDSSSGYGDTNNNFNGVEYAVPVNGDYKFFVENFVCISDGTFGVPELKMHIVTIPAASPLAPVFRSTSLGEISETLTDYFGAGIDGFKHNFDGVSVTVNTMLAGDKVYVIVVKDGFGVVSTAKVLAGARFLSQQL